MLEGARDQVMLPALRSVHRHAWRHWRTRTPTVPMLSRTHGQTGQPDHGRQGNRQRRGAPANARSTASPTVELLGKMNGAVGNYNAHLSAYPEFDWEAFSRKVVEQRLGLTFNPYTIQIEPHDYMAELFDAVARANTILIDLDARRLGLRQPRLLQADDQGRRDRLVDDAAQGQPDRLRERRRQPRPGQRAAAHTDREAADLALAARPDRLHGAAQHGRRLRLLAARPTTR